MWAVLSSLLLLLAVAKGDADAPKAEGPLSKLEALVSSMEAGQGSADDAPAPKAETDADVVILTDQAAGERGAGWWHRANHCAVASPRMRERERVEGGPLGGGQL